MRHPAGDGRGGSVSCLGAMQFNYLMMMCVCVFDTLVPADGRVDGLCNVIYLWYLSVVIFFNSLITLFPQ